MREPSVSILLPVHDAESTLEACLRSIRRQTENAWECVVVDDGSTDLTPHLLHRTADADPRFRVLRTAHAGLVAALNTGLELCRAPLIARMDADDLMHRKRLERQRALLDGREDLVATGCHVRLFPRASLGRGYREYERWLNRVDTPAAVRREAFVECPVGHPTLTIRRESLAALAYRARGWPEDYDLVLRLLARGDEIGVVTERLLAWRHSADRLSRRDPCYADARFTACKAAFLADGFLAARDDYVLWGYGGTGRALRRALERHGKRPSSIVEVHRGRLGNAIHGAPVISARELARIPRAPIVVSVAGAGPRGEIRAALRRMGYAEPGDFVCAA